MKTESLAERIKKGFDFATGRAETGPEQKTAISHEARLKWMEKPFFILQVRGDEKKTVLGRFINPELHATFCPAVKFDVMPGKLVGRKIAVEFLISSDSLPKVIALRANHILKNGPNVIMPGAAIKTDRLQENTYSLSLAIPSGLILNTTDFSVSRASSSLAEFEEVIEEGLSLQDIIDLAEDWQK
jgi:hypothetical protein